MDKFIRRTRSLHIWLVALVWMGSSPLAAQDAPIEGVFALAGTQQAITGQLQVTESGPLTRQIELTFAEQTNGRQIADFDVELTQKLHILATDAGLTHLIHEHADTVRNDGSFVAELKFPGPGLYHVYTDVVPAGLGQQVLRFDLAVDTEDAKPSEPALTGANISSAPLVSSSGPYSVTLSAGQLRPGVESELSLTVEKSGALADDLEPYLGVSAHVVFIHAEDLSYVHAHAIGDGNSDPHSHSPHAAPTDPGDHHQHSMESSGATQDGHGSHGASPVTSVDPKMNVFVTPPAGGTYAVWIEFIGGGEIRTLPFAIEVPEASHIEGE